MEKKQGFLSALRDEVARGLTPSRSRSRRTRSESPGRGPSSMAGLLLPRRWKNPRHPPPHLAVAPPAAALEPLMEGPDPGGEEVESGRNDGWGHWMRDRISRPPSVSVSGRRSDIGLLLGVMGTPLAPIYVSAADPLPHLSIKDTPIETSSAQYILHHYIGASILQQRAGASAGPKLQSSFANSSYTMGKVRMVASEFETATKVVKNHNASRDAASGSFVLWQMNPDKWYVELAVGGSKVHAGCNGKLIWRHTPWLGSHATKGPVRPLRRALQGLDPLATASMFANAQCIGEKTVNGENCFVLKICADPKTLKARSEGPVEIIRHFLFGYFSQRTGLLTRMEDSHLTRIQSTVGGEVDYWETTINSFMDDYRPVEGIMIAHSGRSIVTLFRFSEVAMSHTKTMLEEEWTIEEVAFNVHGLSIDCFIPPADIKRKSISEARELPQVERGKATMGGSFRAKVAALEKPFDNDDENGDDVIWGLEV